MDEYYNKQCLGQYSKLESSITNVIIPCSKNVRSPIRFTNERVIKPITFYNKRNGDIIYENLTEGKICIDQLA